MKRIAVFLAALMFSACITPGGGSSRPGRQAGADESEIVIERAAMPIHSGFKEWIYIDGVQKITLINGQTGSVIVSKGEHVIHAELYTLTSEKVKFSAASNTVKFTITPYSLQDFAIEAAEAADDSPQQIAEAGATVANPAAAANKIDNSLDNTVEGSLTRAAAQITSNIPSKSRMAIVYVTSKDEDITEYIANELEFILVGQGQTLIDRSQLDKIRDEQNLQLSGTVNDAQAVSIGKVAGADIILTGAVTGTGSLRRLRLRALSTETAQVIAAASEKF
jgi:hypothetical protein